MIQYQKLRLFLASMLLFGIAGCGSKQSNPSNANEGPMLTPPRQAAPVDPKAESKNADEEEIKSNLASLSVEDRALAEKQKICPVSDEPLGTMGPPQKINIGGHGVFICCEGCEKSLKSEPEKYLAKLGLQPAK